MNTKQRRAAGMALVAVAIVLMLGGCRAPTVATGAQETAHPHGEGTQASSDRADTADTEMPHIHGLGFSADGRQLIVPAHDGLRVFSDGQWRVPDVPAHDYMGYAPSSDGFYSSGHPHPSSGLANPLGLVKSTDGGKTLSTLGFTGESDFHLMGVGYHNHAIYVLNPLPSSRLPAGLHYSLDDGKTWKQSALQGVSAQPVQIAVHPAQPNVVALATDGGLFLSSDHGATFERVGPAQLVTAASFAPDGTKLVFGSNTLSVYDLGSKRVSPLQTPVLPAQDMISHIAINPVRPEEIAIATFGRNIFRSTNNGQSWEQIAQNGRGK